MVRVGREVALNVCRIHLLSSRRNECDQEHLWLPFMHSYLHNDRTSRWQWALSFSSFSLCLSLSFSFYLQCQVIEFATNSVLSPSTCKRIDYLWEVFVFLLGHCKYGRVSLTGDWDKLSFNTFFHQWKTKTHPHQLSPTVLFSYLQY